MSRCEVMETEIFVTDSIIEAKQIQEILTAHNIPNYLKNEYTQNLFGDSRLLFGKDIVAGSVKIVISDQDIDKALQVLGNTTFIDTNNRKEAEYTDNGCNDEECDNIILDDTKYEESNGSIHSVLFLYCQYSSISGISPIIGNVEEHS